MSSSDKEIAYGQALMKYRRGLITHDEMMAQADKVERRYREENCNHKFESYEREIGVKCSMCGIRKPDPQ